MSYVQIPVVQAVNIDLIDLGTYPLKFGGVKAYETVAEEGMLEVPVQWGSNARVRVSARLGFGGYCVDIPVEVRDIQVCWSAFRPPWSILGRWFSMHLTLPAHLSMTIANPTESISVNRTKPA